MNTYLPKFLYAALLLTIVSNSTAQDTYKRNTSVDVKSYVFDLKLNDVSNKITGETTVTVTQLEEGSFALDLIAKINDYGMTVSKVSEAGGN